MNSIFLKTDSAVAGEGDTRWGTTQTSGLRVPLETAGHSPWLFFLEVDPVWASPYTLAQRSPNLPLLASPLPAPGQSVPKLCDHLGISAFPYPSLPLFVPWCKILVICKDPIKSGLAQSNHLSARLRTTTLSLPALEGRFLTAQSPPLQGTQHHVRL